MFCALCVGMRTLTALAVFVAALGVSYDVRADEPPPVLWFGVGLAGCVVGLGTGYGLYDAITDDLVEETDGYVWGAVGGCGIGALLFAAVPLLMGTDAPEAETEVSAVPELVIGEQGVTLTWSF